MTTVWTEETASGDLALTELGASAACRDRALALSKVRSQCLVAEIGVICFGEGDPSPLLRVTCCPLCHFERGEESRLLRLLVPPGTS